jgi:hypothetical protein
MMLDEDTSVQDMIEILQMYCPCYQPDCNGVLLTLHEATILVEYLRSTLVEPT